MTNGRNGREDFLPAPIIDAREQMVGAIGFEPMTSTV